MLTIVSFHTGNSSVQEQVSVDGENYKLVTLVNETNLLQSSNDTNEKSDLKINIDDKTTASVETSEGKIVIEEKTIEGELQAKKVVISKKSKKPKKSKKSKKNHKKAKKTKKAFNLVGEFKITGYCGCASCCGKSNGITASGTHATAGRTIAADTSLFPFGTKLKIGENVYTVEDRGGAIRGNRIDVFFSSHSEALKWGVRYCKVYEKTK